MSEYKSINGRSSRYFNFAVDLARSLKRDGTIFAHETVKENAPIPSYESYSGPLDKDGKIPYESVEEGMEREAAEDRQCGGYGRNRKEVFRDLCENYDERDE